MLPTWLLWILSPLGRYTAMALIALAAYGAWDLTIRKDERVKIQKQEQVEKAHAVKKATTARARAVKRYDAGRMRDDGFARD